MMTEKLETPEKLKFRRNPLGFCYLEITFVNFLGVFLDLPSREDTHINMDLFSPEGDHLVV